MLKTIHAGHGGRKTNGAWADPGAIGSGIQEADYARLLVDKTTALTGVYNATDNLAPNVDNNLYNIAKNTNSVSRNTNDWNLSYHLNAASPSATGVEVWYWEGDAVAQAKAAEVSKAIASVLGIPDRGAKGTRNFYVISNTTGRMLLVEWAFISNQNDMNVLDANADKVVNAVLNCFGYNLAVKPPVNPTPPVIKPTRSVLKIVNLWNYTGDKWLPEIQKKYAGLVASDRIFGVKQIDCWKARMIHVTYDQAVVICRELRKKYPHNEVVGSRINSNDEITGTTPFAVEVKCVTSKEIDNVIRYIRGQYAGILTGDRIFLTPQANDKQVMLEIHNIPNESVANLKKELKSNYGIADKQFK